MRFVTPRMMHELSRKDDAFVFCLTHALPLTCSCLHLWEYRALKLGHGYNLRCFQVRADIIVRSGGVGCE